MIVVRVKVSRGIESFSPIGIDSVDTIVNCRMGRFAWTNQIYIQITPTHAVVPLHPYTNRGGFKNVALKHYLPQPQQTGNGTTSRARWTRRRSVVGRLSGAPPPPWVRAPGSPPGRATASWAGHSATIARWAISLLETRYVYSSHCN